MIREDLTTKLLPVLGQTLDVGFNVFDVMHHGTHEKQLSNVFRWLLEIGGTHNFESLGQRLFIQQISLGRGPSPALPSGPYTVRQEVNTSGSGEGGDIADLVLENDAAVIVVENYETSDGHGHSYKGYQKFGKQGGKTGIVVILCAEEDNALQRQGWEQAPVVTYERFLNQLVVELDRDSVYAKRNPEQYAFIKQMHRKYASRKGRMSDKSVLDFVGVMCATGEAGRYQEKDHDVAAEKFASDLAQQARERFGEGREVLRRVKGRLRTHCERHLAKQMNATLGYEFIHAVTASYRGIYQWTINFETTVGHDSFDNISFQIKFGPSAWFANERDNHWKIKVPTEAADYSHLFLTSSGNNEVRQSAVALHEILEGLAPDDRRLHDEIIALLNG